MPGTEIKRPGVLNKRVKESGNKRLSMNCKKTVYSLVRGTAQDSSYELETSKLRRHRFNDLISKEKWSATRPASPQDPLLMRKVTGITEEQKLLRLNGHAPQLWVK